jgi:hypothetical protein
LKFNRPFEKFASEDLLMGYAGLVQRTGLVPGMAPGQVPLALRFLGKLVLEVLPAALASVIGGFLFAHYQFAQPAAPRPAADPAGPASAQMVEMVRQEHAMIRAFLNAQVAAEKSRDAAAAAADARAAQRGQLAEAAKRRQAVATATASASAVHPEAVVAAAMPAPPAPATLAVGRGAAAEVAPPPLVIPPQPEPLAPGRASLVAATLAIPGHVVAATLHAVFAVGGIPSWIGHRFGDGDEEFRARPAGAAS